MGDTHYTDWKVALRLCGGRDQLRTVSPCCPPLAPHRRSSAAHLRAIRPAPADRDGGPAPAHRDPATPPRSQ